MKISNLSLIGIGSILSDRIQETLGNDAYERIRENPYVLMRVEGISFKRADDIARVSFGLRDDDCRRQRALALKLLEDASSLGHVYLPHPIFQKELRKNQIVLTDDDLQRFVEEGEVVFDDNRVYRKKYYTAEMEVGKFLRNRLAASQSNIGKDVRELEDLDAEQQAAFNSFGRTNIFVLTGGPGCGKTHLTRKFCNTLDLNKKSYALCAPTGKAAKRLQELTGRPGRTIHRLLGANYVSWKFHKNNLLCGFDYIVVDESSMVDLELAWRLLQALPISTRLVFVGDIDQLPPVGPGSFLRDIIDSKLFSVSRLLTNHRQGEKGGTIAETAIRINRGDLRLSFDDDLQFVECQNPIMIREKITGIAKALAKEYDIYRELHILSPQKQTVVGTESLNILLRSVFNPSARSTQRFTVGDKVMQTVNDYRLKVFNGYVGTVEHVGSRDLKVRFFEDDEEDRIVEYPVGLAESGCLMPAWVSTVHKFQGSEAKAGILIVSVSHTYMLVRNLFYTGITRFREKCIIMGDKIALKRAIENNRIAERYSKLLERLRGSL